MEVPASQPFTVSLTEAMGTRLTPAGAVFRAKVSRTLDASNGEPVVHAGAHLSGRVVSVGKAPDGCLNLRFDTVETPSGPVPVHASLAVEQLDPTIVVYTDSAASAESVTVCGKAGMPVQSSAEHPPTPLSRSNVRLTRGTPLRVYLLSPIRVASSACTL